MEQYRTLTRDFNTYMKSSELKDSLFFEVNDTYINVMCAMKRTVPRGMKFTVNCMGRNRWQAVVNIACKHMILGPLYGGKININGKEVEVVQMMDELDQPARLGGDFWVRLVGVPYGWRTKDGVLEVFKGMANVVSFGDLFGRDNRFLRVKVNVCRRSDIPDEALYKVKQGPELTLEECVIKFIVEEDPDLQEIRDMPLLNLSKWDKAQFEAAPWKSGNEPFVPWISKKRSFLEQSTTESEFWCCTNGASGTSATKEPAHC